LIDLTSIIDRSMAASCIAKIFSLHLRASEVNMFFVYFDSELLAGFSLPVESQPISFFIVVE